MAASLTDGARRLLDGQVFAVLATVSPAGAPQSSVIWVKRDGEDVLFSTIRGRVKTRHMEQNPRISLCLYDPEDPYTYVELRGEVAITEQGGDALIDELSHAYVGKPWPMRTEETRVVCRLTPTKVIERVRPQSPKAAS